MKLAENPALNRVRCRHVVSKTHLSVEGEVHNCDRAGAFEEGLRDPRHGAILVDEHASSPMEFHAFVSTATGEKILMQFFHTWASNLELFIEFRHAAVTLITLLLNRPSYLRSHHKQ